jgi:hypothetical protein
MAPPATYSNRLVKPNPDRSVTLKRGRLYRLLVVANGTPGEEEIRQTLFDWGFDPHDTAVSWPGDWAEHRPRDWPSEGATATADLSANEFLLRASGSVSATRTIGHDAPIAGNGAMNGTLTIIGAWDYGPAAEETMREPDGEQDTEEERKKRSTVLWVAAAVFAGGMIYKFSTTRSGMTHEQEAYDRVATRANRARRAARVRELLASGHDEHDAAAIAEHESWDQGLEHEEHEHEHASHAHEGA